MKTTMRVAMYYSNKDVRPEERPVPQIGEGELLIKVWASGICGSDVMEWYRIHKVPLVLGHEIAGEVIEVGKGVSSYKKGQRIACSHHVPCGECHYCKMGHPTVCETLRKTNFDPGGFAEFVRLPAINVKFGVYPLPNNVTYEEGTFTEPLACVLRAQRLVGAKKGQTVLVIGSGMSGMLHIQMAKVNGTSKVFATDVVDYKLKTAKDFGADAVISAKEYDPERLKQLNDGRLADVVVLCAGAPQAIEQALKSADRGGTVLFFSAANQGVRIPLDINEIFWRNEITLASSYAASPQEHLEALQLISERKIRVKEMITHRLSLTDTHKGFKLVAEARESIKVIIEPQQ
jgi:L-iditol 2-dehydrogenase